MKILLLSDDFPPKSFGGAGIVAFEQARELSRRGHEVAVITTTQDEKNIGRITVEGLTVHTIYANYPARFRAYQSLYNPQTIPSIKNILHEFLPDVIHVHNIHYFLSYHALSLAHQYSKKVILTVHDTMSVCYGKLLPRVVSVDGKLKFDYRISFFQQFLKYRFRFNPLRNFVIRYYLKNVNKILAVSEATAEALRQNGVEDVEVLHNGIDVERFVSTEESIDRFKNKYQLLNKKVIFFAGRIGAAKGGDVALELLERVHRVLPNSCLLIAGKEDSYVQGLMERAKKRGLSTHLVLAGWLSRDEIVSAYAVSDLVLSLSLYLDPFPTVNLEAMASKRAVLGTCFGGTPEIVVDSKTGYVVNPNDIEQVVDRALAILKDDTLSVRLGYNGYLRVRDEFSLSKQINTLEKYYAFSK